MLVRVIIAFVACVALHLPAYAIPGLEAAVDAYVAPYVEAGQFSGVVLIADRDRILVERAYGLADARTQSAVRPNTIFPIASLSKAVTAAAIVDLARQGRLSFEDPLKRFVPEFGNRSITIEQLLQHKSGVGLIEDPRFFTERRSLSKYVAEIRRARPLFEPGKGDEYSNEGYVLLALVIERASGMPFNDYLRRRVFAPSRLQRLGPDIPRRQRAWGSRATLSNISVPLEIDEVPMPGASGLQSDARDLYRWMRALKAGRFGSYDALRYPYGWGRRTYHERRLIEQSGSVEGFGSYMAAYENGHFVVVLSNVQSGMQSKWGPDLASLISGDSAVSRPAVFSRLPDHRSMADYAGDYANPSGGYPLRLRVRDDRLEMGWGSYPFWRPMSVIGPDDLIALADNTRIRIRRDSSGRNSGATLVALDGSDKDAPHFPLIIGGWEPRTGG